MIKTALVIDMELLLDRYFRSLGGEVEFDGEYLNRGRDYCELVIPDYTILVDPEGDIAGLHEVILDDE